MNLDVLFPEWAELFAASRNTAGIIWQSFQEKGRDVTLN
jgi:hypothetical protein